MTHPLLEGVVRRPRHTTAYLDCGPRDAPLIVFVHGWPELAISWRHQLRCFADLGFRCVAPDMRGYGRSSVPGRIEDYALEAIAQDMLDLLDGLGRERAIWIGHDWGAPVVWSLAAHHRDRVVPQSELVEHVYGNDEPESNAVEALVARLRRKIGSQAIGTRRGHGYVMETTAP